MIARVVVRRLPLAVLALVCGCAWTNRHNRPVWNAFEKHLVPEGDAAFYASLPLTVPAGLGAILTDTLVVHPVQVIDDAWGDAGECWDGLEWQSEYYTELALLPFRTTATPLVFTGSFLARSAFDIPPRDARRESARRPAPLRPSEEAEGEKREAERESLALLDRVAARESDEQLRVALERMPWPAWSPALDQAWERAITNGRAEMRMELYEISRRRELRPWRTDPRRGLRDPSAVVRYHELQELPRSVPVSPDFVSALLADPDEAVRDLARKRWPDG